MRIYMRCIHVSYEQTSQTRVVKVNINVMQYVTKANLLVMILLAWQFAALMVGKCC